MAEHDFRYSMLNPQHTLTECRTLAPGRYQVTGNGGSIHDNDQLLVTIKGSKSLHMRLTVEKVRHLINPPGQWIAVAKARYSTSWRFISGKCIATAATPN